MRIGTWLAEASQTWLERFIARHGLAAPTQAKSLENERVLLHVGCGHATAADIVALGFQSPLWREFRLDADATVFPDIVGTMTDMLVAANPQWMSHHCGFTLSTLLQVLQEAGFASLLGFRRASGFDLWVLASKSRRSPDELSALAKDYLVRSE